MLITSAVLYAARAMATSSSVGDCDVTRAMATSSSVGDCDVTSYSYSTPSS